MGKRKHNWVTIYPAAPVPPIILCLSEAEFYAALKDINVPKTDWMGSASAHATTHLYESGGDLAIIVAMQEPPDAGPVEVAALIVHESVHVWQMYTRHIGEDRPGDEQEAYAIQNIAGALMHQYASRRQTIEAA